MAAADLHDLYREAWERLATERRSLHEIEPEGTPVLAFGRWRASRVVTAALNPSEGEFRDQNRAPLAATAQRLLHWPADDRLTGERLETAFARSEGYFTLGNCYARWFSRYDPFLDGLGASFRDGSACHTDYLSPFATRVGIAQCGRATRTHLAAYGLPLWTRVLRRMAQVELIFGHGAGWRAMPALFGFDRWEALATAFDAKGGRSTVAKPFLLFARIRLQPAGRPALLYWWRPNRDGAPLTWLNNGERGQLGRLVKEHALAQGVRT
jgi:hypothetical protein